MKGQPGPRIDAAARDRDGQMRLVRFGRPDKYGIELTGDESTHSM
jgi:hypothetical protein